MGQEFHSKHFPELKYFIHTGFDVEFGCLTYKSLFLKDPMVNHIDNIASTLTDNLPIYACADGNSNNNKLNWINQKDALTTPTFDFVNNIIKKQYFEA